MSTPEWVAAHLLGVALFAFTLTAFLLGWVGIVWGMQGGKCTLSPQLRLALRLWPCWAILASASWVALQGHALAWVAIALTGIVMVLQWGRHLRI